MRGVKAPEDNQTTEDYAFRGLSKYSGAQIDGKRALVEDDQFDKMYPVLTEPAT